MKALQKTRPGYAHMTYKTVSDLTPGANEVKIKVLYSGICGSDIHNFKGEYTKVTPLTLGHEFSGQITDIGKNVTTLAIGDIVSSETPFDVCENCSYCLEEDYNLCSDRKGIGTQIDGSFADYVLAKADRCHKLPRNISSKSAAMLEPLACCVHAVMEKTVIQPKQVIAVFGPGPIGLLMSLVLKTYDVTVVLIGITADKKRLDLASSLGIDWVIDSQADDWDTDLSALTNQQGVDQVFECSGNSVALDNAFKIVKKKGRVIQEGLFTTDRIELNTSLLIHKEIEFIGSRTQKPSSWMKAIALLEEGTLVLDPLITAIYPLAQWEEAFQAVMSGKEIKVLLQP